MMRRIVVVILFLPAGFLTVLWALSEYIRTGEIDAETDRDPLTRLTKWAEQ